MGFEGKNCIRAYGPEFAGPVGCSATPDGLDQCGRNDGARADGRRRRGPAPPGLRGARSASTSVPAWIGSGDSWQSREYPLKFDGGWGGEPFRPTGAARLPNGDMLVLERRFPPLAARLVRVPKDVLEGAGRPPGQRGRPHRGAAHARQLRGRRGAAGRSRTDARLPHLGRQQLLEGRRVKAAASARSARCCCSSHSRTDAALSRPAPSASRRAASAGAAGARAASSSREASWAGPPARRAARRWLPPVARSASSIRRRS